MTPQEEEEEEEDQLMEDETVARYIVRRQEVRNLAIRQLLAPYMRQPSRTSFKTGAMYYLELVHPTTNPARFKEQVRMDQRTFLALLHAVVTTGGLPGGRIVGEGEKLMIFLDVCRGRSNRDLQERWQHSGQTISSCVHQCLRAILKLRHTLITAPAENDPVPARILNDPDYHPFHRCVGAIDGTHIPAVVEMERQKPFRNRKGYHSQNVLAACSFDMRFQYVCAGWEGSAHDMRVLQQSLEHGFPLVPGRYYLADAGYTLTPYTLTPYRGVRYHLKEWAAVPHLRPETKEELFNLRHSRLRNVIERIFGVAKKRFRLLVDMPAFKLRVQVKLVKATCVIHNFIRNHQLYPDPEDEGVEEGEQGLEAEAREGRAVGEDRGELAAWRDGIAQEMWDAYVANGRA
jgi:hypothetical protein